MSHYDQPKLDALKVRWDPASANKLSIVAGVVGVAGIGATLFGMTMDKQKALTSYLSSFMLFLSLALGCLFFVLVQHLVAARWSASVRRVAEAGMATLPVFLLLFVPLAIWGTHELYHWTHAEAVAKDELLQAKKGYLNLPFFYVRAAIYFVVWTVLSMVLWRKSVAADAGGDAAVQATLSLRKVSPPGLLLFALSLTFASFDWLMSLDPHWYSTMFGVYYFAGAVQGSLALMVVTLYALQSKGLLEKAVTVEHYHDLGKLLFGFTVFYAYIAFSQYFLIWYANIPEETLFFDHRWGPWEQVSLLLVATGFVLPFFILMARAAKRVPGVMMFGALVVLFARVVDLHWLVLPNFEHHGPHLNWMNLTALLGVGGVFVAAFVRMLAANALVPVGDPYLGAAMRHENV